MKSNYLIVIILININASAQSLYFPPLTGNTWETTNPAMLGWCTQHIPELYDYLDAEESKAFMVLKDGKIVMEKYFDRFTKDSLWYWASAGKTLTAFLVGIAQQEGYLSIGDPTSKYLGKGWTSTASEKEDLITIWHQLTMTTGLDDGVADNHCTIKECLVYKADAGNRWSYHNAPYTLLRDVLEKATGINENIYLQSRLKAKTGMNRLWVSLGYDNVYLSNARSMARFGILILNNGSWDREVLLRDSGYFRSMIQTSQNLNKSYGYLWWLNGQESFMVPGLQIRFPGSYCPEAPNDMFAGIGKNGQILCIVPSQNLVVMRMGESNGSGDEVSILLLNQIWNRLHKVICNSTFVNNPQIKPYTLYPNPASSQLHVRSIDPKSEYKTMIYNNLGLKVGDFDERSILDIHGLNPGLYFVRIQDSKGIQTLSFIKNP
jgi:CubicO group peptidase (beta-lactamase class C family)